MGSDRPQTTAGVVQPIADAAAQRVVSDDEVAREEWRAGLSRAGVLAREGDHETAREALSDAAKSIVRAFGTDSLEYAETLVARVRFDATTACTLPDATDEHLRRADLLAQAAAIQEARGAGPKLRLDSLRMLSTCLSRAGRRDEGEAVLRNRLLLAELALGPAHIDSGFAALDRARLVSSDGGAAPRARDEEAVALMGRAVAIAKGSLHSSDDTRRAKFLYYMATDDRYALLLRLEREVEAVEESLAAVRLELGDFEEEPMPPGPIFRCRNLAVALARMGRSADSLPLLARAVMEMSRSSERSWDKLDEDRELLKRLEAGGN